MARAKSFDDDFASFAEAFIFSSPVAAADQQSQYGAVPMQQQQPQHQPQVGRNRRCFGHALWVACQGCLTLHEIEDGNKKIGTRDRALGLNTALKYVSSSRKREVRSGTGL